MALRYIASSLYLQCNAWVKGAYDDDVPPSKHRSVPVFA